MPHFSSLVIMVLQWGRGGGGGNCPLQRGFVAVLPDPGDARPGPGRRRRSVPRIFTPCRAVSYRHRVSILNMLKEGSALG